MSAEHAELARLGSATVYEAAGREGLIDADLIQLLPGSRACGPARTVRCGQGDNLMVHAAMAETEPGEVLVLTMPEPAPVALVGELLATQAHERGAAALLVDASVRDSADLVKLGLPIWARWLRVRGRREGRCRLDRAAGRGRRSEDPQRRRRRPRRRRRSGGGVGARQSGAGRLARARQAREREAGQARGRSALLRSRRAARDRRGWLAHWLAPAAIWPTSATPSF